VVSEEDERFMRSALALGRRALGSTWPNPAVGCVIVRSEVEGPRIVGRGWTQPGGRPHAETQALGQAGALARGATAYVTLEPCSHVGRTGPCADALARAGVARLVGAVRDPDPRVSGRGFHMLKSYGLAVEEGICQAEAAEAHLGHFTRILRGRPTVTLKMAVTADRKLAGPGGRPIRITGAEATARVHLLRSQSDAVAVGIGTVLSDDPLLTVRLPGLAARQPIRIVLDSALRLPPASRLVAGARESPVWAVAEASAAPEREALLREAGIEVLRVPGTAGRIDLGAALRRLAGEGLTRILVEAGPTLASALVAHDLVDEAILFLSPEPIGEGVDALDAETRDRLRVRLPRLATRAVGRDMMMTLRRS
jgi:diaminohydroxyphosphoribosylaminopyrimidine deaminase/5-amino-6-(5-phosphoribosylamino)uracil reductase